MDILHRIGLIAVAALLLSGCAELGPCHSTWFRRCSPLPDQQAIEAALVGAGLTGTLDASGYHPPASATVYWRTFSGADIQRRLNPAVPWSGSNADDLGYLGRYAEGRRDVLGRFIASQGVETQGGAAYSILAAIFADAGIQRVPSAQEVLDFGIVHGAIRQLGCADFARLVGRADPGCKDAPHGSGLRPQPTSPVGCCKTSLPCQVEAPGRKLGEVWVEPVLTPQGGRRGCTLINILGEEPPPPPPPPPTCPCPCPEGREG